MPTQLHNLAGTLTERQALPRALRLHTPRTLFADRKHEPPSNEAYDRPRSNMEPGDLDPEE